MELLAFRVAQPIVIVDAVHQRVSDLDALAVSELEQLLKEGGRNCHGVRIRDVAASVDPEFCDEAAVSSRLRCLTRYCSAALKLALDAKPLAAVEHAVAGYLGMAPVELDLERQEIAEIELPERL